VREGTGGTLAEERIMHVFHRTYCAAAIIAEGFQDRRGRRHTEQEQSGVWVSDHPLDAIEGVHGDTLLTLEVPEEILLEYEWRQEVGYREFLVPAALLNQFGPPRTIGEDAARGVSQSGPPQPPAP
jgi:hypothetical protein